MAATLAFPAPREVRAQSWVEGVIAEAAAAYHLRPSWLQCLAWKESNYEWWREGRYQGLFQYSPGTWAWMSRSAGWEGSLATDPVAASWVTAWAVAHGYRGHWPPSWSCGDPWR